MFTYANEALSIKICAKLLYQNWNVIAGKCYNKSPQNHSAGHVEDSVVKKKKESLKEKNWI